MNGSRFIFGMVTVMMGLFSLLYAEGRGRVELAPVFVHLDILESGKTVERLDMFGVKGDGMILLAKGTGFCLKPSILYAAKHGGSIFSGGLGLGHATPITDQIVLTPSIGYSCTILRTSIDFPNFNLFNLKERFRSVSPYVALDASYTFCTNWRLILAVQYAWSKTHTTIKGLFRDTSRTKGPIWAAILENDLSDQWSVNVGAAYNISLSKEKHGLRGFGVKLALVRWF